MSKSLSLTANQKKFIEEYTKDYNARQAYFRAYGSYSHQHPYDILKKPEAQAYLQQLQQEAIKRYGDIAEGIIKELADDVFLRDEENKHSASWQKSVDLLQKQLGLQNQKIDMKATTDININIIGEEDNGD